MRVFGIDPGSERTGYGCVETDGSRHRIVVCGAITTPALAAFPDKLLLIHSGLAAILRECRPQAVAIENLFHAVNVRSALKLGHARGVAMLAAVESGVGGLRVHAGGDQESRGGLRPRREVTGAAHDQAAAGSRRRAVAARRGRCARRGDLPSAFAGARTRRRRRHASQEQGHQLETVPTRIRARADSTGQAAVVIAHLRGRIFEKHPNRLVLDINGVGYDVFVPLSTFYGLGEPGSETALRIHTHVREDALVLYGFATLLEQELFERLIGVSGIGPKVALAVLSGIEPLELIRAIERGDLARLTAIPGVGKKTSERIVLELKDRLPRAQVAAVAAGVAPPETSSLRDDLLSALVNLGYHRPLAEKAVESAIKALPDVGFERTLKQALRELAR